MSLCGYKVGGGVAESGWEMMADEEEEVEQILQKLQELVDQLYSFRDCYFETHSVEDAERKQEDVREEMEKTLQQMEEVVGMSPQTTCNPLPFTEMW
uniref:Uncharacterized protein n=1 Tax=Equus asinus asinus TaxID=83772 RepID=A0A8C4MGE9_EQUAS